MKVKVWYKCKCSHLKIRSFGIWVPHSDFNMWFRPEGENYFVMCGHEMITLDKKQFAELIKPTLTENKWTPLRSWVYEHIEEKLNKSKKKKQKIKAKKIK